MTDGEHRPKKCSQFGGEHVAKEEVSRRLKAFKEEFQGEVLASYREGNRVQGDAAFKRWRERFIEFLKVYDPQEATRFELSTASNRNLVEKESAYNSFMRATGGTCLEVLAGLEGSAYLKDPPKVFLSYAREDEEQARRMFEDLRAAGVSPWFDKDSLLPGQRWKTAIKAAIRDCRFFIAILSSNSINKRGYVQKELKDALEVLDEYPSSAIFIIPVRLDNCVPSDDRLGDLHWVDMFPNWSDGLARIIKTIESQA
jgi:hypothetical protein